MRRFERVMLAVPLMVLSAPSTGQTAGKDTGDKLIEAVTRCRSITGPTERLACFDRASSALETARASNDIAILSREEVAEKRRSLFGFQLPTTNLFGRAGEKMPEIQNLDSTVRSVERSGRDRWVVVLADGSTWKTAEASRFPPETGDSVKIKRAALGTYLASFDGTPSLRIARVQ